MNNAELRILALLNREHPDTFVFKRVHINNAAHALGHHVPSEYGTLLSEHKFTKGYYEFSDDLMSSPEVMSAQAELPEDVEIVHIRTR